MINWSLTIILIPLVGFILNLLGTKFLSSRQQSIFGVLPVILSFIILLVLLIVNPNIVNGKTEYWFTWLYFENFSIDFSFYWDQLSVLLSLIILGIGSLIHIYSIGYLKEESNVGRYFSYMNLFIFFMLILVLSSNLLGTFIGWEGVGLCSYLLIGYNFIKEDAINASPKAFIMNRIGDWGYILAMLIILATWNTLEYSEINQKVTSDFLAGNTSMFLVSVIGLLFFWAACGKSAQFPLFTWLPDAMAGPTPVSALIHAATMVTAGIYLVTRLAPIFILSTVVKDVIIYTGAFTAIIAALTAMQQWDIKKILAYSTVSQLGFMFMAIAIGDFNSAVFHLTTHAFFKAMLFLGAGAVIIRLSHQQDIRFFGKLRQDLSFSYKILMIGAWAISGLPFGAAFFSKDEILVGLYNYNILVWIVAIMVSYLTSFYIFRLVYLTFFTNKKNYNKEIKKLPDTMKYILIILAGSTLIIGFIGIPHFIDFLNFGNLFKQYFQPILPEFIVHNENILLFIIPIFFAICGWLAAKILYKFNQQNTQNKLLLNGFYIDKLYNDFICIPLARFVRIIFIDIFEIVFYRFPVIFGNVLVIIGQKIGQPLQKGRISDYLLAIVLCLVITLFIISWLIR